MLRTPRTRLSSFAILFAVPLGLGACGVVTPPLITLEGEWELVKAAGGTFRITLDGAGEVTETATVAGNITLADPNATGTAELNGLEIVLRTGVVRFEGTFNADYSVATGRQYLDTTLFGTLVTVDEGEATLTRVD